MAVVGVGGAGCNIAEGFFKDLAPVTVIAINTDERSLLETTADRKVLLYEGVSKFASIQRDAAFGRKCARSHSDDISNALHGHDVVVIIAGMGGGTGTGATPVVVEIARELNIMTLTIAVKSLSIEGRDRSAKEGLEALRSVCPAMVTIQNDLIFEKFPDLTVTEAFGKINKGIRAFVKEKVGMISETLEKEICRILPVYIRSERSPMFTMPAFTFV